MLVDVRSKAVTVTHEYSVPAREYWIGMQMLWLSWAAIAGVAIQPPTHITLLFNLTNWSKSWQEIFVTHAQHIHANKPAVNAQFFASASRKAAPLNISPERWGKRNRLALLNRATSPNHPAPLGHHPIALRAGLLSEISTNED